MDFKTDVLDRSQEIPVVVDFWAPWCGPCRILGPVIEQLAEEQKGRWELVKVNTEEDYEWAERYQVMSIPNVKMFYKGEAVAEFVGALPRTAIENWLEQNLPDERKQDLESLLNKLDGVLDPLLMSKLELFVEQNPDVSEARVALAQRIVFKDPEKAQRQVEPIYLGDKWYDAAEDIRTLARFLTMEIEPGLPVAETMGKAREAIRVGDPETGIQRIIEALQQDKSYQDDLPRKTGIALFRTWGDRHELTKKYRWRFDMAIY